MYHEGIAKELSQTLRQLLIQHIDRPYPLAIGTATYFAIARLMKRELVTGCSETGGVIYRGRPSHSRLTEEGRGVACWILAEYADGLMVAGAVHTEIKFNDVTLVPRVNALLAEIWQRRVNERAHA